MEGIFTHFDIFANKGTEYILVVLSLVIVIVFWRFLWFRQ
jgi:hypothetical protein